MSEVIQSMKFVSAIKAVEKQGDDKYIYIKGVASTENKDRHGDIIPASLWTKEVIDKFLENPVLLSGHNHSHQNIVGAVTSLKAVDNGLEIEAKVLKSHAVSELIEEELLKMFSISFITKEWDFDSKDGNYVWIAKDIELLEISLVAVGANADARFSVEKSLGDNYEAFKNKHSQKSTHMDFEKIKGWLNGKASKEEKEQVKSLVSEKEVETPEVVVDTPEVEEVEAVETPEAVVDNTPEAVEKSAELKEIEQLRAEKAALEAKLAKKEAKPVSTEKDSDPNPSEMTEKKLSPMEKGWEIDAEALRNFKR